MASNNPGSSNAIAGALAIPANNENRQFEPMAEQPRQPRNLQGLLRFALEATRAEDALGNSSLEPMDEERRRFLAAALRGNTVNVSEMLQRNIRLLTNMDKFNNLKEDDALPEDILAGFEELGEYVDDIDIAKDFDKLGGFLIFPMCYSCDCVELHRWANLTLAKVCQNNPQCQGRALRCCLLPVLIHRLKEHLHDDQTIRALSSIIRNYEPTMLAFIAQGGCQVLARLVQIARASELPGTGFLILYLCRNSKEARDEFIKYGTIQAIVAHLKVGRNDASEHLLNVLVVLLEYQPEDVMAIYKDPELDLKRILQDHLDIEDVKNERFSEEKEYCETILRLAFYDMNGVVENMEAADR